MVQKPPTHMDGLWWCQFHPQKWYLRRWFTMISLTSLYHEILEFWGSILHSPTGSWLSLRIGASWMPSFHKIFKDREPLGSVGGICLCFFSEHHRNIIGFADVKKQVSESDPNLWPPETTSKPSRQPGMYRMPWNLVGLFLSSWPFQALMFVLYCRIPLPSGNLTIALENRHFQWEISL